ncbi:hypothetical protein BBta_4997 [Bradyrhizobium sp. BTAi1]|nr:hypothetical protein BBta_4997 [Bradyrhizobium sp. BTAi1]
MTSARDPNPPRRHDWELIRTPDRTDESCKPGCAAEVSLALASKTLPPGLAADDSGEPMLVPEPPAPTVTASGKPCDVPAPSSSPASALLA